MKKLRRLFAVFLFSLIAVSLITSSMAYYSVPDDTIVYVTPTGECYHREDCTYTTATTSMTIKQAEQQGYRACSRCDPDVLSGEYVSNWDGKSGGKSTSPKQTPLPTPISTPKPISQPEETKKGLGGTICLIGCALVFFIISIRETCLRDKTEKELQSAVQKLNNAQKELQQTSGKLSTTQNELYETRNALWESKKKYKQLSWVNKYDCKPINEVFLIPEGFTLGADGEPTALLDLFANDAVYQNKSGVYHLASCIHVSPTAQKKKLWEISSGQPCKVCRPPCYDFTWYSDYKKTLKTMTNDGVFVEIDAKAGVVRVTAP